VVLVGAALPATLKPLHGNREGHKHAGLWLAEQLQEHQDKSEPVIVLDPFEWVKWYSGQALYYKPHPSPKARIRYTVLDNKNHDDDHARLPGMDQARAVKESGEPVYWWPENVSDKEAKVVIYKTVGPSELEQKQGK
jgi:hypothetical protein